MAVPSARARSSCSRRHVRDAAGAQGPAWRRTSCPNSAGATGTGPCVGPARPGRAQPTPPARNDAPSPVLPSPSRYARAAPREPQPARRQRALRSQEHCMGVVPVTCLALRRTRQIIRSAVTVRQINEKYVWILERRVSRMCSSVDADTGEGCAGDRHATSHPLRPGMRPGFLRRVGMPPRPPAEVNAQNLDTCVRTVGPSVPWRAGSDPAHPATAAWCRRRPKPSCCRARYNAVARRAPDTPRWRRESRWPRPPRAG